MKKKLIWLNITMSLLCLLVMVSCKKGFLEKEPLGKVGKVQLFDDVAGAELALNGAYNRLANYYSNEFGLYGDVAGDELNVKVGNSIPVLNSEFNFVSATDEDELAVGKIWRDIFDALNNVNNVINGIPPLESKFPGQVDEIAYIKGSALILRALCHFDVSKVYAQTYTYQQDAGHLGGAVLLKTPSPGEAVSRRTMKETYAQIIKDASEGVYILKRFKSTGPAYMSAEAGWALLSRVYLYMGEWDKSISYSDSTIAAGSSSLTPANSYYSMFTDWNSGTETIWQLNVSKYGSKTINAIYSNESTVQYYSANKLLSLFDSGDIRRMLFRPINDNGITRQISGKYSTGDTNPFKPFAVKMFRLSEIYLNRAEASFRLGKYTEAAEDLRLISQRAHPNSTITITYASPEDLFQQISDERRRELCFEGHRFYDIARRHENIIRGDDSNSSVKQLTYPNNRFVLPIPSKELDANPAMQPNPGINN